MPVLCPVCKVRGSPKCPKCEQRQATATAQGMSAASSTDWCCSLDGDVPQLLSVEVLHHILPHCDRLDSLPYYT